VTDDPHAPPAPLGESEQERLDRNTTDLLNELRVAGSGVQVLFGFLLILPFSAGWKTASTFDRAVYFATLLCIATGAVLLIAPSVHHRLLFRRRQKLFIVETGTRLAIAASCFLAAGLTGILVLVSNYEFGTVAAVIVAGFAVVVVAGLWFGIPLLRRRHHPPHA
jgi:Family of unknown function (DUF6328)